MNVFGPLSAVARFSMAIDGLLKSVAARISGGRMDAAMIMLIWTRIRRIETRVLALIAAIRAGKVRGGWVLGPRAARARVEAPDRPRLPRKFAWLCVLVPYEAAGFAENLRRVLAEPEMVALLSATPRMGKLLGPLCRMLGIEAALVSPVVADAVAPVRTGPAGSAVGTEDMAFGVTSGGGEPEGLAFSGA